MTETARPTPALVGAAFLGGLLLGGVLVAPAFQRALAALPSFSALGPVGTALVAGVLGIVVVVLGLVASYFLLLVVEG